MTTSYNVHPISLPAGAEMKDKLYEIVKYNATQQVILCTGDTDNCIGVVWIGIPSYDPRSTIGRAIPIAPLDPSSFIKVKAGGVLTAGHYAVPDGSKDGKIKGVANEAALPNGVKALGIILDAATAENDIVRVHPGPILSAA